jgi:hypothetical protein
MSSAIPNIDTNRQRDISAIKLQDGAIFFYVARSQAQFQKIHFWNTYGQATYLEWKDPNQIRKLRVKYVILIIP